MPATRSSSISATAPSGFATESTCFEFDDSVVVKRLALNPKGRRFTVQSDNPAYPDWPDCSLDQINCIGRVIWAGRRIV